MRIPTFCLAVLICLVSCSPDMQESNSTEKIESIENGLVVVQESSIIGVVKAALDLNLEKMNLLERIAHYQIPGVSITVINDFKTEWSKGYGVLEAGSDRAITTDTYFEAGSVSKLFTSVIVHQLIEKGVFDLDTDINEYLTSWHVPDNEFTTDDKVTLRLILSHQSGINQPDKGFGFEDDSSPTLVNVLNGESPATNLAAAVEFFPGSKHQYSNMGFVVLQAILEDVLGKPFPQIAEEMIFKPLGMSACSYEYPLGPDLLSIVALPHDGEGKAHDHALHPSAVAHGGLMITANELASFALELMRAWQGRSELLISQKTAQLMLEKERKFDLNEYYGFSGQGLGVFILGDGDDLYFSHPGYNYPGTNCMLIGSPVTGQGAIIMANGAQGLLLTMEIMAALMREYEWPVVDH